MLERGDDSGFLVGEQDLKRAWQVAEQLEFGMVGVNEVRAPLSGPTHALASPLHKRMQALLDTHADWEAKAVECWWHGKLRTLI